MLDGEDKITNEAVKGEASAFGLLYDHYQPQIYRFVMLKTGRREEAEDLTHQVFLHAWQNIGNYKDLGYPFSSWLYRIARNQVIDYYRVRKNALSLEDADSELIAQDNPETDAANRLEFQKLTLAVKKLKPDYQDIVILRFVEELSIREVAGTVGKSEGAVKLLQHRALKQLKKILEE